MKTGALEAGSFFAWGKKWSERQDLDLRRLGPKPSALARLSYAPMTGTEYLITAALRNVKKGLVCNRSEAVKNSISNEKTPSSL